VVLPGHPEHFQNIDEGIRQVVVFRLDSIGFGVLTAFIYHWHKSLFMRLSGLWWLFLPLAVFCMVCTKWGYFGLSDSKIVSSLYFSLSAIAFAGLIPVFTVLAPTRLTLFNRFMKYTSLISYSMYLGHIFAIMFGIGIIRRLGVFNSIYPNPWLAYPIFLVLVYLIASATYFFIEKPVLAIRDRKSEGPHW
jgi:peptidoglycan/LPS O-acetylase OafA/YrhL